MMVVYHFFVKRYGFTKYINHLKLKKTGQVCYNCVTKIEDEIDSDQEKPLLCKSCHREVHIQKLLNPHSNIFYQIKYLLLYRKFEKFVSIILYLVISFNIIGLVLNITKNCTVSQEFFSITSCLLLLIYWILMVFRVKVVMSGVN